MSPRLFRRFGRCAVVLIACFACIGLVAAPAMTPPLAAAEFVKVGDVTINGSNNLVSVVAIKAPAVADTRSREGTPFGNSTVRYASRTNERCDYGWVEHQQRLAAWNVMVRNGR